MLTDLKTGASFPTTHRLHPHAPGLFVTNDAGQMVRDADVILSLDWIDLGGSIRQACGGKWPNATVIQCSLDQYVHTGWQPDYQALPPAEISMLAQPDRLVRKLLDKLGPAPRRPRPSARAAAPAPNGADAREGPALGQVDGRTASPRRSRRTTLLHPPADRLAGRLLPLRASARLYRLRRRRRSRLRPRHGGRRGAGAARAESDRLPVAILGDGDFLMGVTALWTAVHYARARDGDRRQQPVLLQ